MPTESSFLVISIENCLISNFHLELRQEVYVLVTRTEVRHEPHMHYLPSYSPGGILLYVFVLKLYGC
jgi:hypothetical protein